MLIAGFGLGLEKGITDGVDALESIAFEIKDRSQFDRSGSHLFVDVCEESLTLGFVNSQLAKNHFRLSQTDLQSIIRMIKSKLVIEVPAELVVKINKGPFQLFGGQSQD